LRQKHNLIRTGADLRRIWVFACSRSRQSCFVGKPH